MDAANSSCSFKKQDLTSKKVKFLQLIFVFIDFLKALFGNNFILHQTKWKNYPVSRGGRQNVTIFGLLHQDTIGPRFFAW